MTKRDKLASLATFGFVIFCGAAGFWFAACTPGEKRVVSKVELDLCQARASWRVIAAAAGGALDPMPGSVRARLEADEDAFCAAREALAPDSPPAGSEPLPSSTPPKN
jgi:hypothetical protein